MINVAMDVVLPVLGISLVLTCVFIALREQTRVATLNLFAATFLMISLLTLPDTHGVIVDQWTHMIGLGAYIARVTMTLAACCHIVAACLGVGRWDRKRKLLLVPGIAVGTLLYTIFWLLTRDLTHAESLLYAGYYPGRPGVVLGMSLVRGIVVMWYCAFGVYTFVMVTRHAYPTFRWRYIFRSSTLLMAAFGFATLNGASIIAEAIADHLGKSVVRFEDLYTVFLVLAIGTFAVVYVRGVIWKPLARWMTALVRAPRRLKEANAAIAHALEINSHIDDKLVLMVSYADPDIRRAVKNECNERDVSYDERLAVLAAAMIVTLHPENQDRLRQKGDQAITADDYQRNENVEQLAAFSATDVFFFSDVYLIAALACGAERLGINLRRTPLPWHRRLATLLEDVLARYDQPEQYRLAYQRELLRREQEKQRLMRDLPHLFTQHVATT